MNLTRILNAPISSFIILLAVLSILLEETDGAKLLRSNIAEEDSGSWNRNGRQDDYDSEDDSGGRVPWVTPRIKDLANGLDGILQGIIGRNPDKLLEGSFEFIPSPVRVGVKGILSTIAGRPVAQTPTTKKPVKNTISKLGSPTTTAPENDSEEDLIQCC